MKKIQYTDQELASYYSNELDQEKREEIHVWMTTNRDDHDDLARIWLNDLSPLSYNKSEINIEKNWNYFEAITNKKPKFIYWLAAAVIVFAFGISFLSDTTLIQEINIETSFGEQKLITLSDGSTVQLNYKSKISFPDQFSESERRVILEGEAIFSIVKNSDSPFIVETKDTKTRVLGTKFNLHSRANVTTLSVSEGSVLYQSKSLEDPGVIVTAGQYSKIEKGEAALSAELSFDSRILWPEKKLIMRNVQFQELAFELNLIFGKTFKIEDEKLASKIISASINFNQPIDKVLELMKKSLQIKIRGNNDYIIYK